MINFKGSSENLIQVEGPKTSLDTNEPTAPYIIGWELISENCPVQVGVEPTTFQTAATDDDKD